MNHLSFHVKNWKRRTGEIKGKQMKEKAQSGNYKSSARQKLDNQQKNSVKLKAACLRRWINLQPDQGGKKTKQNKKSILITSIWNERCYINIDTAHNRG